MSAARSWSRDLQTDHGGENALKDSTKDIEDISSEPDDDELKRESIR